jgi:hypothetical protein
VRDSRTSCLILSRLIPTSLPFDFRICPPMITVSTLELFVNDTTVPTALARDVGLLARADCTNVSGLLQGSMPTRHGGIFARRTAT